MKRESMAFYAAWASSVAKNGRITPDDLVAAATDEKSDGHSYFTWDDSVAGHKWRLEEARNLLSVHVTVVRRDADTVRVTVPAFVRDPDAPAGVQGYVATPLVDAEQDKRAVLDAELRRIYDLLNRRVRPIAELFGMANEVADTTRMVGAMRDTLRRQPELQ